MLLKCSKDYEKKRITVDTALKDAVGVINSASDGLRTTREALQMSRAEIEASKKWTDEAKLEMERTRKFLETTSREIAIHREYMSRTKEELKTPRSISWVSFGFLIINSALLGYIVWLLNGGF